MIKSINCYVIGGGISGLTAGYFLNCPILEEKAFPGGLLNSYFLDIRNSSKKPIKENRTEFDALVEYGGGHWIWGLNKYKIAKDLLFKLDNFKKYRRNAAVYLKDYNVFVPYPIQYNLWALPKDIRDVVIEELFSIAKEKFYLQSIKSEKPLSEYLEESFGKTLYQIFFRPYNEAYTDKLMYYTAPPRKIKLPCDINIALKSAFYPSNQTIELGYNPYFFYPCKGLGKIIANLTSYLSIYLNSKIQNINLESRILGVEISGKTVRFPYRDLYVAIPLNKFLKLCGMEKSLPYLSVIVINGVFKKPKQMTYHWVYLSKTKTGFHRIGYYSNVDTLFLPKKLRRQNYVTTYIEKTVSYLNSSLLETRQVQSIVEKIIAEAKELELIGEPITYTYDIVEVAYTLRPIPSLWLENLKKMLEEYNLHLVGRYASWGEVEGIAESMAHAYSKVFNNFK